MSEYKGIDVSNNNGNINFSKVKLDNLFYVYLKATEGSSYKDRYMNGFYNGCKENELKCGAYHFLVSTSIPENQAENFCDTISSYDWDLIPMLDVESNFNGVGDYVIRFINKFRELSSLELGIYTYTSFISYLSGIKEYICDMKLWEANYNNNPWNLKNNFFNLRVGHQYTEKGSVSGVNGYCDLNVFTDEILLNSTIPGRWLYENSKWWYKHDDQSYTKAGWEKINGMWYLFDEEGWMKYSWQKDDGQWYFMGNKNDGAMKTGWVLSDGNWYYFDNDGGMKTGWMKINVEWYYFNDDGTMATGWIKDNNKDYLLYSNGKMAHDTEIYGYRFDSDGSAEKI